MTRKHFEALAKALANTRPAVDDYATGEAWSVARYQWVATRDTIAHTLASTSDNPLFDRERFVAATEA